MNQLRKSHNGLKLEVKLNPTERLVSAPPDM